MTRLPILLAGLVAAVATPAAAQPPAAPRAPALPPAPPAYDEDEDWLCLPGRADPCGEPLAVAPLAPSGFGPVARSRPAADAPVDCFYLYPTISRDPQLNSDLDAGAEENGIARAQAAPFHETCRVHAPIYRQVTLASFAPGTSQENIGVAFGIAYADVRNAWRRFLAERNSGRPIVLIGHSQGAIHLEKLIKEEIEGKEVAGQIVSAILLGWNIEVPEGRDVGGTFTATPLCTRPGQTGCVVTYVSFRHDVPPPNGAMFGRAARPGMTVGCTNPATLAGGSAPLRSLWPAEVDFSRQVTWSSNAPPPAPFVRTEGLVAGECVHQGPVGYLAVRVAADPADTRTDEIPGDLFANGQRVSAWGLHLVDMALAMDDLVALVRRQIEAFVARGGERG